MSPADLTRRRLLALAGRGLLGFSLLGPGLGLPGGTARAACPFAGDGVSLFRAMHRGRQVGRRSLSLERGPGGLLVRQDLAVEVGPAARPLRRVRQRCEEVWREGWLQSLTSDSEIDGARWRLRASRRGADEQRAPDAALEGEVNGLAFTVSGYAVTSTFWHGDSPKLGALLDVTDGRVKPVEGRLLGTERLIVAGESLPARHYAVTGGLEAELWYDEDCRLLQLAEPLPDHSLLLYELA